MSVSKTWQAKGLNYEAMDSLPSTICRSCKKPIPPGQKHVSFQKHAQRFRSRYCNQECFNNYQSDAWDRWNGVESEQNI